MLRPVFVAKGPHPSFYQILWPLCLQISGADHHKVTTIIGSSLHTKAPLQIWSGVWAPEHRSDEGWSPSHWYIELFPIRPICYQTAVWDHKCYKLLSCCFIVIITVLNYMLSDPSYPTHLEYFSNLWCSIYLCCQVSCAGPGVSCLVMLSWDWLAGNVMRHAN